MSKKEKPVKVFKYEGKQITFDFGDGQTMVSATQMIKVFPKKRMNNFFRSTQTRTFLKVYDRYAKKRYGNEYKAFRVIKGGTPELQGTWMDERLALKFAAWLNPEFELWVYDRIFELLTTGQTSLHPPKDKVTLNRKHLEWVFRKIQDNAMENFHLSELLEDLKKSDEDEE